MARIFHTAHTGTLRLGRKIGAGGEGEVYEVQERDDLVAKLYFEPPSEVKAEKLLVLSTLGAERLLKLTAWPVDVLREDVEGRVAGFLMNRISQAEEVHALHSPRSRLQKFPEASWAFLIYAAANIARAVAAVHEHGLMVGDLNPKNILVTRKATVCLLDCDSFQVTAGGRTFRCESGFPEYTPPELQGLPFKDLDRRPEHDNFGLGIVIFQLLFVGRHPFSGRFQGAGEMPLERAIRELRFAYGGDAGLRQMQPPPGALPLDAIPASIAALFRRAFLSTAATDRPLAREWVEPLETLAKSLKRCKLHSGHYHFAELAVCPWCAIETRAQVRLFNFALAGADGNRPPFHLDEIWRQIESVSPPVAPLTQRDQTFETILPSREVRAYDEKRFLRLLSAVGFSAIAGFAIGWTADYPMALFLAFLAGVAGKRIAKAELLPPQMLMLFQPPQSVPDDPVAERYNQLKLNAENAVRGLEERLGKEASAGRFQARLEELRTQRNVYADLAQVRARMLKQLAAAARDEQPNDYLGQARSAGISPQAKVAVEKEMDVMRHRLEHELQIGDRTISNLEKEGPSDGGRIAAIDAPVWRSCPNALNNHLCTITTIL